MTERSAERDVGHLDEGTIHAWLDGALSADEARAAEAHAAACPRCAAAVAEARGLIAAASRILLALDDVPGGVVPATIATAAPRLDVTTANSTANTTANVTDAAEAGDGSTAATAATVTPIDEAHRRRGRRFRIAPLRAAAAVLIAAAGTTIVAREASREHAAPAADSAVFTAAVRREVTNQQVATTAAAPASVAAAPASVAASASRAVPDEPTAAAAAPPSPRPLRRADAPLARVEQQRQQRQQMAAVVGAAAGAAADVADARTRRANVVPAAPPVTDAMKSVVATAPLSAMGPPPPTPKPAVVAGIVRDVEGNALPGVDVTLGTLGRRVRTDSAGRYVLENVPPGRYVAEARRIGYASERGEVAVTTAAAAAIGDTTSGPVFALRPTATALSQVAVAGSPRAEVRQKTAAADAAAAAPASASMPPARAATTTPSIRAAAGCYDLRGASASLPPLVVLDTTRALAVPADDERATPAYAVHAPGGATPPDVSYAYWAPLATDSVRVVLLDAPGAGVELRARVSGVGLRGTARQLADGRPTGRARDVVAPRASCGR